MQLLQILVISILEYVSSAVGVRVTGSYQTHRKATSDRLVACAQLSISPHTNIFLFFFPKITTTRIISLASPTELVRGSHHARYATPRYLVSSLYTTLASGPLHAGTRNVDLRTKFTRICVFLVLELGSTCG